MESWGGLGGCTCFPKVCQSGFIHREEPHGCPVLWTHVGDGCPVSDGQVGHAWAEELNELANDTNLTQVL